MSAEEPFGVVREGLQGTVTFTPIVDGDAVESAAVTAWVGEWVLLPTLERPVAHRARRENWVVRFARWLGVMPL